MNLEQKKQAALELIGKATIAGVDAPIVVEVTQWIASIQEKEKEED